MSTSAPFPLAQLVDDLIVLTLTYMPIRDLGAFAQVSKRFYRLASCNYVWNAKIRERPLLRLADMPMSSNLDDVVDGLVNQQRWCVPTALLLRESELLNVHAAFALASEVPEGKSITFRGKRYPVLAKETVNWWRRWRPKLRLITDEYYFYFLEGEVMGKPGVKVSTTHVTMRTRLSKGHKPDYQRYNQRTPAAACVNGVIAYCPPPPLPFEPSPEAFAEPAYSKFLYRHALVEFEELCYLCAVHNRHNCHGTLLPFCRRCWLTCDVDLFMSAEQARAEFFIDGDELDKEADWCTKENKVTRKTGKNKLRRLNTVTPPKEVARFYREFQVAYYAHLKWGSSAAIERKRAQQSAVNATAAKLAEDLATLADFGGSDIEMTDKSNKRKRSTRQRAEEDDYRGSGSATPVSNSFSADSPARRSVRKAALEKKSYVFNDEEYVIGESTVMDLFRWGLWPAQSSS